MKAISIENKKEKVNYTIGRNCYSSKIESNIYVIFENNASKKLCSLCSEIGNNFGFKEAEKIKKSKSEKNILEFINKYEDFLLKYVS